MKNIAIAALILAFASSAGAQVRDSTRRDTIQINRAMAQVLRSQEDIRRVLEQMKLDELEIQRKVSDGAIRIAELQRMLAQISAADYDRLHLEARLSDSLLLARTADLYRNRAISQRDFENRVGPARSDSIVRQLEQRARRAAQSTDSLARTVELMTAQQIQARLNLLQSDTARARQEAILGQQFAQLRQRSWYDTVRARSDQAGLLARYLSEARPPLVSLGMGLACSDCTFSPKNGVNVWAFKSFPTVGAVEKGSMAERLGLRIGDTLRTIDGISLATVEGGERLSALAPGSTVSLGWRRNGVAMTATAAIPPLDGGLIAHNIKMSANFGGTTVEVRGLRAFWSNDQHTGAMRISGDSLTVIITPPGGGGH
jgi:hypothetical protein